MMMDFYTKKRILLGITVCSAVCALLFSNIGNINGAVRPGTGIIPLNPLHPPENSDTARQRTGYVEILKDVDFQFLEEAFRVIIAADGPIAGYQLFFLNNPLRMVIDLPGDWKNSGKSVLTVNDDMIRRIRVGEHPGDLRVVMDLFGKEPLSPTVEELPKGLSFTMRKMPEYLFPSPGKEMRKTDTFSEEVSGLSTVSDTTERILKDILYESSAEEFHAVVSSDKPIRQYSSFFLTDENPPKLVVDLAGKWKKPGKFLFKAANTMVQNIRVGIHPAYLRIVMDLKEKETLASVIEESPEGLSIRVKKKEVVNFE